jgi:hypothetical protein
MKMLQTPVKSVRCIFAALPSQLLKLPITLTLRACGA